jgi:hypothetical protein
MLERERRSGPERQLLSEVYRSFTEGFDTADLKDASVVLQV